MTSKSSTERQRAFRQRMREQGLKEIRSLFAHPADFLKIRKFVERLNKRREKDGDKG